MIAASTRIVSRPSRKTSTPLSITALVRLIGWRGSVGSGVPPWACQPRITAVTQTASTTAVQMYRLICEPGRGARGRGLVLPATGGGGDAPGPASTGR